MRPLVSVVIPAYNAGAFIDASVASALAQTLPDLEVIVVDDGSTDDTSFRLSAFHDPRLRVITQPNRGLADALNTGIRAARGEYLGFLDADDIWLPDKLERHIQALQRRPGIDVTFSWVRVIDENGRPVAKCCPHWRGDVSFAQLLSDFMIRTMSAVVMRRAAAQDAGMIDGALRRCLDLEFFLRVALLRPDNITALPEVLTLYRRHATQRTRDWRVMRDGWMQVLDSTLRRAPQAASVVPRASSNMYRYFAMLAYEAGEFREALHLAARSFAAAPAAFPWDVRNWFMGGAVLAGVLLPAPARRMLERWAGPERTVNGAVQLHPKATVVASGK